VDPQLRRRCTTQIQHIPCTELSARGDKVFGPSVNRFCYKYGHVTTVRNVAGEEVSTSYRLIFDGIISFTRQDEVMVDSHQYPVISYTAFPPIGSDSGTTVVTI
jgi:hypothetical protein